MRPRVPRLAATMAALGMFLTVTACVQQSTLPFTASRSGQFPLELHAATDEIELAIVTVHEH